MSQQTSSFASTRRPRWGCASVLLNLLAFLILLAGCLLVMLVGTVFAAPDLAQSLLGNTPLAGLLLLGNDQTAVALPTSAAVAIVPTASHTPDAPGIGLLPTWTPPAGSIVQPDTVVKSSTRLPTLTPSATPIFPTNTPTRTPTPTPTNTPTETPPGPTPTPSATRAAYPFTKSNTSPFYLRNFANNAGCQWLGIAGEVLDLNRNPVAKGSYRVHIWDSGINKRVDVGSAPAYSPSGWEQFVFDSPVVRSYRLQLETPNGTPVSEVHTVQTRASCNENLLRFDFVQNH